MSRCLASVHRFEDLIAWQLSVELRDEIIRLTDDGQWACQRDRDFTSQIRKSSRSSPSNLAEGFGAHKAMARLIKYLDSCNGRRPVLGFHQ
jgi:four helix bundle protein